MNIFVAAELSNITPNNKQQTKTQIKAAVDEDAIALLVSEKFYRVVIPTNRLASPIMAMSAGAVIADVNVKKMGTIKNFTPKVIVVSGQTTFRKAHHIQSPFIEVWLGSKAIKAMGLDLAELQKEQEPRAIGNAQTSLETHAIMAHCVTATKDGEEYDIEAAHRSYKRAVSRGYVPKVEAVAPPGWEDTVKKMKDHHGEIDNPWALAWWMQDQGYTPHSGKK